MTVLDCLSPQSLINLYTHLPKLGYKSYRKCNKGKITTKIVTSVNTMFLKHVRYFILQYLAYIVGPFIQEKVCSTDLE